MYFLLLKFWFNQFGKCLDQDFGWKMKFNQKIGRTLNLVKLSLKTNQHHTSWMTPLMRYQIGSSALKSNFEKEKINFLGADIRKIERNNNFDAKR